MSIVVSLNCVTVDLSFEQILQLFETPPPPPFRDKPLIIVFRRIRIDNHVRIIRVIFFFMKKFSHRQDVQIAKASVSTSKSNRNTESAKKTTEHCSIEQD